MQTASFSGFMKTLFYILAFYYIFKFLLRIFFPIIVKKVVEKAGQKFQQQQQNQQGYQNTNRKNPDEIVIDTSNAKKTRETKKVGDYVDYEEID